MPDIIYRYDPHGHAERPPPRTTAEARERLLAGNSEFTRLFEEDQIIHISPAHIGIGTDGEPLEQMPYAALLSCSDARVPTELIFRCRSNELFVVRVAGNVPGDECLGSLEYAAANLGESLQLTVVLGHTGCGAVTAAVDTYLEPRTYPRSGQLRSVVDRILPGVRIADKALTRLYGRDATESPEGREALLEAAVVMNAALAGMTVHDDLRTPVEFGVFDLVSREVSLMTPPRDNDEMVELAVQVATSERVGKHLAR